MTLSTLQRKSLENILSYLESDLSCEGILLPLPRQSTIQRMEDDNFLVLLWLAFECYREHYALTTPTTSL